MQLIKLSIIYKKKKIIKNITSPINTHYNKQLTLQQITNTTTNNTHYTKQHTLQQTTLTTTDDTHYNKQHTELSEGYPGDFATSVVEVVGCTT